MSEELQFRKPDELVNSLMSTYSDTEDFFSETLNKPRPERLPIAMTQFVRHTGPDTLSRSQEYALRLLAYAARDTNSALLPHIERKIENGDQLDDIYTLVTHEQTMRSIGLLALRSEDEINDPENPIIDYAFTVQYDDEGEHLLFDEHSFPPHPGSGCPYARQEPGDTKPKPEFRQFVPWYGKIIVHSAAHHLR